MTKLNKKKDELEEFGDDFDYSIEDNYFEIEEEKDRILAQLSDFIENIHSKYAELELMKQQEDRQKVIEQAVLQQLKELTPGIQTLLARISELTSIEKDLIEKAITRLIKKHPDLGSYDKTSQVFILGENMPTQINDLIDKYPKPQSFEELLTLLKQGREPNLQELNFLVIQLYKKIETCIRTSVKTTEKLDFKDNIGLAYEQDIIDEDEIDDLHKFRKIRNQFIHDDREDFPYELMLSTYSIFKRIKGS